MSTSQVPGFIAANADNLHVGCWAEAPDGSLMQIESVQGGTVNYSVIDRSSAEPSEYYGELIESAFKAEFSDAGWTWHDKSPFPWAELHGGIGTGELARHTVESRNLKPVLTH